MRRRALTAVAVALLASAGVAAAIRSPASAACASLGAHWRCRTVTVPLDPSGHVAGRIRLAVTQYHAPGPHRPAVFAFAGGPGGAAVPKARKYRRLLAPLLRTRDLVLFDERGTGGSDALSCSGVEGRDVLPAGAVARCARTLGAAARFYGSARSADDAEAVRRALGVPRVVAYGVSYGTKTATEYARRHPAHVAGLVLDSVVVADTDPLYRRSAVAAARILRTECRRLGCGYDPVRDLEALIHGASRGRVAGTVGGRRVTITEGALLNEVVEGGAERRRMPAALHAAAAGRLGPLAALVDKPAPDVRSDTGWLSPAFSATKYLATTCEDASFPWAASASRAARRRAAARWLSHQGDAAYAPFDHLVAGQYGITRLCLNWPAAHRRRVVPSLPDVPAILFSGEDDALTPLEGAREVAAELPRSELVVVPGHGHVVLSETGSAATALARWARAHP